MRDPVSRRATSYGVALGLMNGIILGGLEIATNLQGAAHAHNGGAFILMVLLSVLSYAATVVSVVLLLQLGYVICRHGGMIGRGVGAGIQAGFLAGAVTELGAVLGLFVALAMRHSNPLTLTHGAAALAAVLLLALVGAGMGAGLAAIGATLGQRRYRRSDAT